MHTIQVTRTLRLCEAPEERESDLAELVTYNAAATVAKIRRARTQRLLADALATFLRSRGLAS